MGLISTLVAIGNAIGVGAGGLAAAGGVGSVAAGFAGAALVGGAAYGATSLLTGGMSQPCSQMPQAQAQTQTADQIIAESQTVADEKRKDLIRSRSRRTVLTGPTGLFEEADTAQKTLLGG